LESSGPELAAILIWRDEREERDWREGWDGRRFEVRSSKFSELRTPNPELLVTPFSLVPLVPLVALGYMI
jgi:hypothetical protein